MQGMIKLLPLVIILAVVLACGGSRSATPPAPPESTTPSVNPKLSADVSLTGKGIVVKNTDSIDFPSMTLKINLKDWGSDDGRIDVGGLVKGKSITIPYSEFTVGTARFDLRKTKILTVYVKSGSGSAKLFLCAGAKCRPV